MNRRDVLTGSLSMAAVSMGGGSANANPSGCIDGLPEAALFSTEPVTQFPVAPMNPDRLKDSTFLAARFKIVEGPKITIFPEGIIMRGRDRIEAKIKEAPDGFKFEVQGTAIYVVEQFEIINPKVNFEYKVKQLYFRPSGLASFWGGVVFNHRLRDLRLHETSGMRSAYVWAHPDTYRDGVLKEQSMIIVPFAINAAQCSDNGR
jgi:hypothetical protein